MKYLSERACSTDFPILACAVALVGDKAEFAIGARPMKAELSALKKM